MGFINKDIFIISAKDLTQEVDKTYLDMSTNQVLLKTEAPELANIYGTDGSLSVMYEGNYPNPNLNNSTYLGKKIGDYYISSGTLNAFRCINPDLTGGAIFGNTNNWFYFYESYEVGNTSYLMSRVSSGQGSLQVATIDFSLATDVDVGNSFSVLATSNDYFETVFGGDNPGAIDERFYSNDDKFFIIGETANTFSKIAYINKSDFIVANTVADPSEWSVVDISGLIDLVTYPNFFLAGQDRLYFTPLTDGKVVLFHTDYDVVYRIDLINQTADTLTTGSIFGNFASITKGNNKVYLTKNDSGNTFTTYDLDDFSVVYSGNGSRNYVNIIDGVVIAFGDRTNRRTNDDILPDYFVGNDVFLTSDLDASLEFRLIDSTSIEPRMVSRHANLSQYDNEVILFDNNNNGLIFVNFVNTDDGTFTIEAQTIANSQHKVYVEKK